MEKRHPPYEDDRSRLSEEVLGETLQHAAGLVDADFRRRIEAAGDRSAGFFTALVMNDQRQVAARRQLAFDIEGFGAIKAKGQRSEEHTSELQSLMRI